MIISLKDRQLKYEASYVKMKAQEQDKSGNNNSHGPTLKLDVMSLEGHESF